MVMSFEIKVVILQSKTKKHLKIIMKRAFLQLYIMVFASVATVVLATSCNSKSGTNAETAAQDEISINEDDDELSAEDETIDELRDEIAMANTQCPIPMDGGNIVRMELEDDYMVYECVIDDAKHKEAAFLERKNQMQEAMMQEMRRQYKSLPDEENFLSKLHEVGCNVKYVFKNDETDEVIMEIILPINEIAD